MPDAVTKTVLLDNRYVYGVHLTNISDGTGEAAVNKGDKSALAVASDGAEAASLDLVSARWAVQGMSYVKILWDHNTDDVAIVLANSGFDDFGYKNNVPALPDPRSSGGTGDILLTTAGQVAGGSYDITLWFSKAPD